MFFYLWKTLENSKHKCTHFNIINIIWLPLYHPHSPGFYLPVAAGGEMETLSQHRPGKTASDDGRRDVGHWALCPCSHHLHPGEGAERGPVPGGTARLSVPRGWVKAGASATWFLSPLVALLGPQAPSDHLRAPSGLGEPLCGPPGSCRDEQEWPARWPRWGMQVCKLQREMKVFASDSPRASPS